MLGRVVAAAAAVAIATAPITAHAAESRHKKHHHHDHEKKKKRDRHRHHHHHRERKPAANMPEGWTWPPNRTMVELGSGCRRKLDALGIGWKKAKREGRIATPIELKQMELAGVKLVSVFRKPPYTMDCHLALGLATYLPQLYDLGVRELRFSSIHRDTKVRVAGQTKNMMSRHALGLAIDVRSFVDATGREAVVETDYPAADTLLLQIEQVLNDSGGFRTVLTPRNDPKSHYDHFHLEVRVEYPSPTRGKPSS